MTELLLNASDISNHIDKVLSGIGARGSSFRDVDRLTIVHNGGQPARFMFQELKWRSEWDSQADGARRSLEWMLTDLARLHGVTAVVVIVEPDEDLTVRDYGTQTQARLSPAGYQDWFRHWWFPNGQAP